MYKGMYDGLYQDHIKKVSVYDGAEFVEIPRDEITFEEESLVFKHWTRLELVDFPFVSIESKYIEIESIVGRVLNQVVVTFDFDVDPEYSKDRWIYSIASDPLEVQIVECSDEQVLDLYKDDLEGMILDEMRRGLEIEQEDLDVNVE